MSEQNEPSLYSLSRLHKVEDRITLKMTAFIREGSLTANEDTAQSLGLENAFNFRSTCKKSIYINKMG